MKGLLVRGRRKRGWRTRISKLAEGSNSGMRIGDVGWRSIEVIEVKDRRIGMTEDIR